LNNINNDSFVPKESIFVSLENSNIEQLINNKPKNILFSLTKNKIDNIIFFLTDKINDTSGIIGAGEETKEINFYNIINNTIFKINIFFFDKNYILIYYYKINKFII
jgi:hypothetical protein